MNKQPAANFNSKILLFGEYSIIQESMGLTLPYEIFHGKLSFDRPDNHRDGIARSNRALARYVRYLKELREKGELLFDLDLAQMERDVAGGIHFDSSIPQGFGVGSSGALVAAIYDRYAIDRIDLSVAKDKSAVGTLKRIFAQMESFFHGTSSGVDPLICYINMPLLIRSKDEIQPVKVARKADGKGAIFLIDTGKPRETAPLVKYYMEKMEEGTFREFIDKQLKPFTNNCIQAFLRGDHETLFGYLTRLSAFQFDHFKPMIPQLFKRLWKKGLDSGEYYLKLCGAGGGGFILGFTQNFDKTRELLKQHKLELVCHI